MEQEVIKNIINIIIYINNRFSRKHFEEFYS